MVVAAALSLSLYLSIFLLPCLDSYESTQICDTLFRTEGVQYIEGLTSQGWLVPAPIS